MSLHKCSYKRVLKYYNSILYRFRRFGRRLYMNRAIDNSFTLFSIYDCAMFNSLKREIGTEQHSTRYSSKINICKHRARQACT